jgi:N-acyl-D-aspartate/D-glutamate deacylase
VRERQALSLEHAVWRLTGQPRQAFRVAERGLVQQGLLADLVAFDPDTVGTTPVQRVWDQPSGADRLVVHPTGVEHVWVNGVATRVGGAEVEGVAPGRLIRS